MCIDGAGAQDRDLQQLYSGCWNDLFLWVYRAYDMTDDSWEPTGKFDACNISLPFAKMVNSVFLFPYILTDVIGGCRQWHSREDYTSLSRAASNRFHGPFYLQFTQYLGSRPAHAEIGRTAARDRTVMHCPLFDVGHKHDTPSFRASVLIHEAWHHWQYEHDFDPEHQERDGEEVDYFYRHTAEAYAYGQMHSYFTDAARFLFLSPYQAQAEFLDDLHIFGRGDLPIAVRMQARLEGNAVLEQKFKNPPRYRIGEPKPF